MAASWYYFSQDTAILSNALKSGQTHNHFLDTGSNALFRYHWATLYMHRRLMLATLLKRNNLITEPIYKMRREKKIFQHNFRYIPMS